MIPLSSICLYSAGAGVLSHIGYFRHGEFTTATVRLLQAFLLVSTAIFIIHIRLGLGWTTASLYTATITASYLASLFSSIIIYRLFFHRIRAFPGPTLAKLSNFWRSYHAFPNFQNFLVLENLRKEYGDFVRVGPNEIAIFDPAAVPLCAKLQKGPFYDSTLPLVSMQTTRDHKLHAQRRRLWDKGFNAKALRGYEQDLERVIQTLVRQMHAHAGQAIDMHKWFFWTAFDSMGVVAFGKPYGTTEKGESHFALEVLYGSVIPFAVLGPIPWAFHAVSSLPGNPFTTFVKWCADQIEERKQAYTSMENIDVMGNLISSYLQSPTPEEWTWLNGDSRLIVLAGTETTAGTLIYLFSYLAKYPEQQTKLRTELLRLIEEDSQFYSRSTRNSPHLDAVINETLRLWPPVLSGIQHTTPPEGITIGKTYIPGNVNIVNPSYAVQRREDCYVRGNEFIPERWYSQPELIKDNTGYAPFALGPASCVGKQLALFELRAIVTQLVTKFSVAFAPEFDQEEVFAKTTDHFASTPGPLRVVLTAL
ncbi:putative P450 monooxygenase [Xylogone sp. PMI_703]|nr:putative P450 monooxygenase [Xylogone sp. PMI_703]